MGEDARCIIVGAEARRALGAPVAGGPFDIVFLDPPYDADELAEVVDDAAGQRAEGGILVVEHASRRPPPLVGGRPPDRSVKAGDSTLSFYS